jgi:hypothetical protein
VVVVLELSDPTQAIAGSAAFTALSIMHAAFTLAG